MLSEQRPGGAPADVQPAEIGDRLADDPAIELRHHPVAFGGGQERAGQHDVAVLVAQADQQFDVRTLGALRCAVRLQQLHFLVIQQQPFFLDHPAQAVGPFHLAAPAQGFVVLLGVEMHAVAAAILGHVAGGVGMRQHIA